MAWAETGTAAVWPSPADAWHVPRARPRWAKMGCMPPPPDEYRCVFVKNSGKRCGQPREQADNPEHLWCTFHTEMVGKKAIPALRMAPGAESRVSPMAALLEEIERSQLMVRWYETILADKSPEELLWVTIRETREGGPGGGYDLTRQEERPHPALVLLKDERAHLANVTRLAIQSGIESRQLELNERTADVIITAMIGLARLLGQDPTLATVKALMAQALRAAREGRVVDGEIVEREDEQEGRQALPPGLPVPSELGTHEGGVH